MATTINIYKGTDLQIPREVIVDDVFVYQDIISKLITMGEKSGKLYTLDGHPIDNKDVITIHELNYITLDMEPYDVIKVVTNTDSHNEILVPYSSDMTYEDIYNIALAQSGSRLGFLRVQGVLVSLSDVVTDVEGLSIDLGVLVHISTKGELLTSIYILEGSIYQDIISAVIRRGHRSGRIYTLQSAEVDPSGPILEPEVHYVIMMSEPSYTIPVTVVGAPLYIVEIPGSADMVYLDVYNYVVSQVNPNRDLFLVTNNGRTILTQIITQVPIFAFYELP